VAESPVDRCRFLAARQNCRVACPTACGCEDARGFPVKISAKDWAETVETTVKGLRGDWNGVARSCGWVAESPVDRCGFPAAREHCLLSCATCPARPDAPLQKVTPERWDFVRRTVFDLKAQDPDAPTASPSDVLALTLAGAGVVVFIVLALAAVVRKTRRAYLYAARRASLYEDDADRAPLIRSESPPGITSYTF